MTLIFRLLQSGVCTLAAVGALNADATELFVSGSGSDQNAGVTKENAFRTVGKAATLVNPGDTVWLLDGQYDPVVLNRSGTASAPITWKAYPGNTPEIAYGSSWKGIWWSAIDVSASYQMIDGLTLTGNNDNVALSRAEADYGSSGGGSPEFNSSGIALDNRKRSFADRVHHLVVRNSTVRKFGCGGVVALDADYVTIENNRIYENAWYSRYGCSGATIFTVNVDYPSTGTGYHNIVRGNMFWNNRGFVKWKVIGDYSDGNGFILDTSAADYGGRTLLVNNLSVHNGGSGLHAFQARHADIFNNTAYLNGDKVNYADIFANESTDIRLYNNVVHARVGGKVNETNKNTDVTYNYNVYFNGVRATTGANDVIGDPLFVNPGLDPTSADFRLRKGSPAIDNAISIVDATPLQDLAGMSRPRDNGLDRGAYEFITPP
jgi:hypothetical protein